MGTTDVTPKINEDEVDEWKYISARDLKLSLGKEPDIYTEWFKIICEENWNRLF